MGTVDGEVSSYSGGMGPGLAPVEAAGAASPAAVAGSRSRRSSMVSLGPGDTPGADLPLAAAATAEQGAEAKATTGSSDAPPSGNATSVAAESLKVDPDTPQAADDLSGLNNDTVLPPLVAQPAGQQPERAASGASASAEDHMSSVKATDAAEMEAGADLTAEQLFSETPADSDNVSALTSTRPAQGAALQSATNSATPGEAAGMVLGTEADVHPQAPEQAAWTTIGDVQAAASVDATQLPPISEPVPLNGAPVSVEAGERPAATMAAMRNLALSQAADELRSYNGVLQAPVVSHSSAVAWRVADSTAAASEHWNGKAEAAQEHQPGSGTGDAAAVPGLLYAQNLPMAELAGEGTAIDEVSYGSDPVDQWLLQGPGAQQLPAGLDGSNASASGSRTTAADLGKAEQAVDGVAIAASAAGQTAVASVADEQAAASASQPAPPTATAELLWVAPEAWPAQAEAAQSGTAAGGPGSALILSHAAAAVYVSEGHGPQRLDDISRGASGPPAAEVAAEYPTASAVDEPHNSRISHGRLVLSVLVQRMPCDSAGRYELMFVQAQMACCHTGELQTEVQSSEGSQRQVTSDSVNNTTGAGSNGSTTLAASSEQRFAHVAQPQSAANIVGHAPAQTETDLHAAAQHDTYAAFAEAGSGDALGEGPAGLKQPGAGDVREHAVASGKQVVAAEAAADGAAPSDEATGGQEPLPDQTAAAAAADAMAVSSFEGSFAEPAKSPQDQLLDYVSVSAGDNSREGPQLLSTGPAEASEQEQGIYCRATTN